MLFLKSNWLKFVKPLAFYQPRCKKVPASALFIVIVFSLVIGLLSSSLIFIGYYYKLQVLQSSQIKKLESNLNSAINLLLANTELFNFEEPNTIDLYGEQTDSVYLYKKQWGLYEVGMVKAFHENHTVEKTFLYGYSLDTLSQAALYLTDLSRPLTIAGKTLLTGDCYLPEAGIIPGIVDGQGYPDERLVQGKIKRSHKYMPSLNQKMVDNFKQLLEGDSIDYGKYELTSSMDQDTIRRSFIEKTLLVKVTGLSRLHHKFLYGNIIILSDTALTIDVSCNLHDVMVIAKGITIEDKFHGSLQAFAKDSILVGENCNLLYPSALALLKFDFEVMRPWIEVKRNSVVTGVVLSRLEVQDLQQTIITINESAKVYGQVYADGFLQLKGSVIGNVMCNRFYLQTHSAIYENHLVNASINRVALPKAYVGSSIIHAGARKKIIKYFDE